MPIYEYQCEKCRKLFNFLVRNITTHKTPVCPKCGHPKMTRAISRFAALKAAYKGSSESNAPAGPPGGMPEMPPGMPDMSGLDENDPRSLGRMMRQMADQTGETLDPQMNEVIRRLESGEDPEKIEEMLGDELGAGGPGGPGTPDNTLYEG